MRLDELSSDDAFIRPVLALDQYVGFDFFDKIYRGRLVEDRDVVNAFKSCKDFGSIMLVVYRAVGSFNGLDRAVTIEPDDDYITLLPGELQIFDVSSVDDIEAAVCKNDSLVLPSMPVKLIEKLVGGSQFAGLAAFFAYDLVDYFFDGYCCGAEFLHFYSSGDVGQVDGGFVIAAGGQRCGECSQDHVAGSGDIIDAARPGRHNFACMVCFEVCAFFV